MNDIIVSSEKQFGKALFGLNKNEVYSYLNQVRSAYEELQLQIQVLKEQNDKLSDSNRDNALKLYNLQNEITEAQRKTDRSNVELEALKKENRALRQELDAAERRIQKLTDELIKSGGEMSTEEPVRREDPRGTVEKSAPEPIFAEPVQEEAPKTGTIKDIFADLRREAAQETAAEEKQPEPVVSEAEPISSEDGEEVYAGEVEVKVDESMLIGNDDDEDEGFNFL